MQGLPGLETSRKIRGPRCKRRLETGRRSFPFPLQDSQSVLQVCMSLCPSAVVPHVIPSFLLPPLVHSHLGFIGSVSLRSVPFFSYNEKSFTTSLFHSLLTPGRVSLFIFLFHCFSSSSYSPGDPISNFEFVTSISLLLLSFFSWVQRYIRYSRLGRKTSMNNYT